MFQVKYLMIVFTLALVNSCMLNTFKRQHEDAGLEHIVLVEADKTQVIAIHKSILIYLASCQRNELLFFLHMMEEIANEPLWDTQKINRLEAAVLKLTAFSYLGFDPVKDLPLQMKNKLFLHRIRLDYANCSYYEYEAFAWPKEQENSCFDKLPSYEAPAKLADSFCNSTPLAAGTVAFGCEHNEKCFLTTASDKYYHVPFDYLIYSTRLYCRERQTILGKAMYLLKSQKKEELAFFLEESSNIWDRGNILGFSLEDSLKIRESCEEAIAVELLEDDAGFKIIQ